MSANCSFKTMSLCSVERKNDPLLLNNYAWFVMVRYARKMMWIL